MFSVYSYQLLDDFGGAFAVDAVSGDVMTTVPLDREQRDDYELVVQASDHGAPPLTSHVSVHVTVVDPTGKPPVGASFVIVTRTSVPSTGVGISWAVSTAPAKLSPAVT